MFDSLEKRRGLTKWILQTFALCILLYLGVRHINAMAMAVAWLADLIKPLLLGLILALVFNVPMSFLEDKLLSRYKLGKGKRALAIVLALLLVLGIFVGVAFLVVPELIEAVKLIIEILSSGLDWLALHESDEVLSQIPALQPLASIDVDWLALKLRLEEWFRGLSGTLTTQAVEAVGSVASKVVTAVLSFTFSIYILAQKETLKRQVCRLVHVWLPKHFGDSLLHVARVCGTTFNLFIAGQATEAVILGVLCMIGMAILGIPYAPMVGALVGVTALIPIVGAFVGTIIGAVMILTVDPLKAVIFVIFLLALQQVEGNAIYPRVVGSKIKLPAIWVLTAVTVGGNLGGPIGMLLGVPAASSAYALLREATNKREQQKLDQAQVNIAGS